MSNSGQVGNVLTVVDGTGSIAWAPISPPLIPLDPIYETISLYDKNFSGPNSLRDFVVIADALNALARVRIIRHVMENYHTVHYDSRAYLDK